MRPLIMCNLALISLLTIRLLWSRLFVGVQAVASIRDNTGHFSQVVHPVGLLGSAHAASRSTVKGNEKPGETYEKDSSSHS
jgi:hypothetical protein